jgi:hypothetical protein
MTYGGFEGKWHTQKNPRTAQAVIKARLTIDILRRDNQAHLRSINNIFIEAELCVQGLKSVLEETVKEKAHKTNRIYIAAPTAKGKIGNISRKIDVILDLLEERIANKEYFQSLIFAVALVEDYMSKTLVRVIRDYPDQILISIKGNPRRAENAVPVDIRDILRLRSIDDLILENVNRHARRTPVRG